ncbi:hypothetical protein BD779DRAFT_936891 [Infundibulicybe gibba]|nr:hypothetical protein BD779DRAFT_936891 [Infundibulicybe gibba]
MFGAVHPPKSSTRVSTHKLEAFNCLSLAPMPDNSRAMVPPIYSDAVGTDSDSESGILPAIHHDISLNYWMSSSPLEEDPFEVPSPSFINFDPFDYSPDESPSWSYGGSPCYESPPFFSVDNDVDHRHSIPIATNSPKKHAERDGMVSLARTNGPINAFGYDFTTSSNGFATATCEALSLSAESPPKAFSWPSPSRTLDGSEAKSPKSRDSSPSNSENDHHNQRRRFPCLILGCSRRFTSQYTLKVHMEAHKPKPRTSFPCTLGCSERFSRQHDRLRHEVAKHGKVCEFLCDDCGRFFSTKKTLGNHKCPVAQGGTRWVNS